jgi:hypothetical protein
MPQIDNPDALSQTLAGQIKELQRRMDELSAAPIGKVKPSAGANSSQGFSWTGAGGGIRSWITVGASITVPPLATTVSIFALATSVVCSNSAANTTAFSLLAVSVPELGYMQSDGPNVYVQTNQQAQRSRSASIVSAPVTPGSTLTVTANGDALNTGTNVNNFLGIDAFAIFQY